MLKSREELKTFYGGLNNKYEGYIQMSDKRIEHVFTEPSTLPKWSEIHNEINYILEMALYDSTNMKSILIRQHNAEWLVVDKTITKDELKNSQSYFTVTKDTTKMKIAQIWEPKENEFCEKWDVLEPKYLLFAGFKKSPKETK